MLHLCLVVIPVIYSDIIQTFADLWAGVHGDSTGTNYRHIVQSVLRDMLQIVWHIIMSVGVNQQPT